MKGQRNAILDHEGPLAFAHRGGAASYPENTLLAFEHAAQLGCDVLELDVHATSDGHLVVLHDATLERTTNGHGAVSRLTLRELARLDAGARFTRDGVVFPFRGQGLCVPTLDALASALPDALLNVELKAKGLAELLCAIIEKHELAARLVVAAHSHEVMADFRRRAPGIATSASRREAISWRARCSLGSKQAPPPFRALQVPPRYFGAPILNASSVAAAHRLGVRVHAWTINDEPAMRALLDLGVDGIMTDRPELLLPLVEKRRKPPEPSGSPAEGVP